jgi:S-formylglutathione hydrolase FrmB/lysophospholipase L1-like esterase
MINPDDRTHWHAAAGPLTSPRVMVVAAWLAVLLISVYAADDLAQWMAHDDQLSKSKWVAAVASVQNVARASGLAALRRGMDHLASPLKRRNREALVAAAVEPPRPPAMPPPSQAEPEGEPEPEGVDLNADAPKRILLVGASSIQYYLGVELERGLESYRDARVLRVGRLSTGLSRPDQLDWNKEIARLAKDFKPDLVIGMFGGNDAQNLDLGDGVLARFGTRGWDEIYAKRVSETVAVMRRGKARAVMLGMPVVRSPSHSRRMERVNRITREATEAAGGIYIPTWDLAADPQSRYQVNIEYDGERGLMYLPDGVHYTRLGARYIGERILWRLERSVPLVPKNGALAVAVRRDPNSKARGRKVPYLAYVPQAVDPDEKLPVLYLLHGAGGSWGDWSDHAHLALQQLAEQHRLIIVTPDGEPHGWYLDGPTPGTAVESYLTRDLIRDVERYFPASSRRAIAGLSMGGHGALTLGLKHPGLYLSASSMSGAVDLTQAKTRDGLVAILGPYVKKPAAWLAHSALHLVRAHPDRASELPMLITVGSSDRWAPANRALHAELLSARIDHVYEETRGDHDWQYWTSVLPRHVAWHAGLLTSSP